MVVFSFQKTAFFESFSQKVQTNKFPRKQQKAQTGKNVLDPTVLPVKLVPWLSDLTVGENETVDLKRFIPVVAVRTSDILNESSLQMQVGKEGGVYDLEFSWDADSSEADVCITLFDDYLRPIMAWRSPRGVIRDTIRVEGGLYKFSFSCAGELGEKFRFNIRSTTIQKGNREFSRENVIPRVNMDLTLSAEKGWRWMLKVARHKFAAAGGVGQPAAFLPNTGVRGRLTYGGNESVISISLSGVGSACHFDEKKPSFAVNVLRGPLLFGMEKFKLYNTQSKEGILGYVVTSIMKDEGIFVPGWKMIRLYVNNEYRGIYFLEERYSPALFDKANRYDGEIHSFVHHLPSSYYRPPLPSVYYRPKATGVDSPAIRPFYTDVFTRDVNKDKFAKALAFITRFHGTHGVNESDFRYYRNPLLNEFEPVIRDIDVDMWGEHLSGNRSFLIHSQWWFGKKPPGMGTHYNRKTYPGPRSVMTAYTVIPSTLGLSGLSPGIPQFLADAENRILFEKYLFYAADKVFLRRFLRRIYATLEVSRSFLDSDEARISWQCSKYVRNDFMVPRYIPFLQENSWFLIAEGEGLSNSEESPGRKAFFIYNLSCFSMEIKLPKYAVVTPAAGILSQKNKSTLLMTPSMFYPMIDRESLSKENVMRLLQIERLRYFSEVSSAVAEGGSPLLEVSVPENKDAEFLKFMQNGQNRLLGGTLPQSEDKLILYSALSQHSSGAGGFNFSAMKLFNGETKRGTGRADDAPEVVFFPVDVIPTAKGYLLRYLVTNNSVRDVEIDLSKIRISVGTPKEKFVSAVDVAKERENTAPFAWGISGKEAEPFSGKFILGASVKSDSPSLLWTDTFQAVLDGPGDPGRPNAVLLQTEIMTDNELEYYITDPEVLRDAVTGVKDLRIVVHEYCINVLHPHSLHENWNEGPASDEKKLSDYPFLEVTAGAGVDAPTVRFRDKDVMVSSLVIIPEGYVLEIAPGTVLRFAEGGGIVSFSPVKAVGTEEKPIIFEAREEKSGWSGLAVIRARGQSFFRHVKMSGARGGKTGPYYFFGGISVLESSVDMAHVEINRFLSDDAIHLNKSWFSIRDLKVRSVKGDGLDVDWSFGRISDSEFSFIGGDCVDFSGSLVEISECDFNEARDKGVSAGEGSVVSISSSDFLKNKIGIAIKDQAKALVDKCNFMQNQIGIATYIKKPVYTYPLFDVRDCKYSDNAENIAHESALLCTRKYD